MRLCAVVCAQPGSCCISNMSDAVSRRARPATLGRLRKQAARCTACPLYARATQTVFGDGPARAKLMLIGEQPGDREDIEGRPFVGPAGELLARALHETGIERQACYITNAVKHFKWEPRGKRRIHKTPAQREIDACRRWLVAEVAALRPALLVCLGATAAQAVLGRGFRLMRQRGQLLDSELGVRAIATLHPSAVLRMIEPRQRARALAMLIADLKLARAAGMR
ncbi:MAG TPA: UdgX family uracil-DNA binding protein [Steroidobacteraceae bacterium]|jgi:DNA polymerase